MILKGFDDYHIPRACEKCGGVMIFKGIGEYQCESCGEIAYDDYGKVRRYIEEHRGANLSEIQAGTGVNHKTIRQMVRESRFEVAEGSKTFISCESCGQTIRSGRLCPSCEAKYHRGLEEEQRQLKKKNMKGFSAETPKGESGERRFMRRDF